MSENVVTIDNVTTTNDITTAENRKPRGLSRRLGIALKAAGAFILSLFLILGISPPAQATTIYVAPGTCSGALPTDSNWGTATFNLGSHPNTYVTINTAYSWGWKYKLTSYGYVSTPWARPNHYNVRFLDAYGRVVWTEYNSVANGGRRSYYVGSNVRSIQVSSDYYYWGWVARPYANIDR